MKKPLSAVGVAVALAMPLVAATAAIAAAATGSIDITTTRAIATGDRYYDTFLEKWVIFRPIFTIEATVVCEAGTNTFITFDPVPGNTLNGVGVTCTGSPQTVTFNSVAALRSEPGTNYVTVTATLHSDGSATDSDTQVVKVTTRAKDRYPNR